MLNYFAVYELLSLLSSIDGVDEREIKKIMELQKTENLIEELNELTLENKIEIIGHTGNYIIKNSDKEELLKVLEKIKNVIDADKIRSYNEIQILDVLEKAIQNKT